MIRPALSRRSLAPIFALAVLGMLLSAAPAHAGRGPLYGLTYPSKIGGKLWRGVSNIAGCWLEYPVEINKHVQNTDPLSGPVVGVVTGTWYTVRRFGLGVVDAVTFPIDVYGNNYQSIQRSEFPFIDEVD